MEKAVDCTNLGHEKHIGREKKCDICAVTFYTLGNDILNISLFLLSGLYYRVVNSKVSIISESNRGIYIAQILFCPTYSLCLTASGHVQNVKPKRSTFSQCFLGRVWACRYCKAVAPR